MSKKNFKGKLIAIEGGDGTGKQTISTELYEHLIYEGFPAILISFPRYYTLPGKEIRRVLYGAWTEKGIKEDPDQFQKIDPIAFGALYAWDRNDAKPSLLRWLIKGNIVITDRYVRSNQAYQGARRNGEERKKILDYFENLEFGLYGLPRPDLNIFLDLPVTLGKEAMKKQKRSTDINEKSLQYQQEVRKIFRRLHSVEPKTKNLIISCINRNNQRRSRQEIADKVWEAVNERILNRL